MIKIKSNLFCDCLEPLQTEEELETGECKLCKFGSSLNTLSQNIQKRFPLTKWTKGLELYKSKAFKNTPKSLYRFLYLWEPKKIDFSDMYKSHLALINLNGSAVVSIRLFKYELAAYFYVPIKDIVPKPAHFMEIHCGIPGCEKNIIRSTSQAPKEIELFINLLEAKHDVYGGNNFIV
jgi:hypothetical protein